MTNRTSSRREENEEDDEHVSVRDSALQKFSILKANLILIFFVYRTCLSECYEMLLIYRVIWFLIPKFTVHKQLMDCVGSQIKEHALHALENWEELVCQVIFSLSRNCLPRFFQNLKSGHTTVAWDLPCDSVTTQWNFGTSIKLDSTKVQ